MPIAHPDLATRDPDSGARAEPYYLALADISGYTAFLQGVARTHGVDFSAGIPAGYSVIGALLDAVVGGLASPFAIAKIEGDAVFATAPVDAFDGRGEELLERLRAIDAAFRAVQAESTLASDHLCTACPVAGTLWLKFIVHRGFAVTVTGGTHTEIHGPAVNVVHRLLKNHVTERIGVRPYVLLTRDAATALGLAARGRYHVETYPDVGTIAGRILRSVAT